MTTFLLFAGGGALLGWLVLRLVELVYARWGSQQARTLSPRDGGLPANIIPPRSRWHVALLRAPRGYAWKLQRRSYADALATTTAPYLVKWVSWSLLLAFGGYALHVWRWRERWSA